MVSLREEGEEEACHLVNYLMLTSDKKRARGPDSKL